MTALVKLLWDFPIQTDYHLDHNRPDIVVLEKEGRMCFIVDIVEDFLGFEIFDFGNFLEVGKLYIYF